MAGKLKVAVQMDPIESINVDADSTFALMLEAQARGHALWHYEVRNLSLSEGMLREGARREDRVTARARAVTVQREPGRHWHFGEPELLDLGRMDVVLMRQDPPFDMAYITASHMLEHIQPATLVVNDPAAVLSVSQGGVDAGSALVPLKTWVDVGGGWRVYPQQYVLFSGFQYRYDPGIPLVGIGALVLLAGLIISFYFLPARLYVRVEETAGGCTVGLAATTVKGYDIFAVQFNELIAGLKRSVEPPGPRIDFTPAEAF